MFVGVINIPVVHVWCVYVYRSMCTNVSQRVCMCTWVSVWECVSVWNWMSVSESESVCMCTWVSVKLNVCVWDCGCVRMWCVSVWVYVSVRITCVPVSLYIAVFICVSRRTKYRPPVTSQPGMIPARRGWVLSECSEVSELSSAYPQGLHVTLNNTSSSRSNCAGYLTGYLRWIPDADILTVKQLSGVTRGDQGATTPQKLSSKWCIFNNRNLFSCPWVLILSFF